MEFWFEITEANRHRDETGVAMPSLSHTIRRFNRFEMKYLITLQQAERIKSTLRAYLLPDEHGDGCGRYVITSLYYDSPDLRCYWEKADGIKFRRKLRLRRYEADEALTDEAPVFVEIKQRIDRVTQKRRAILPYRDALRLCNDRQIPDHELVDRDVIEEVYAFVWQYNLRPASIVRYVRQAFIGTDYDLGLRVTLDISLSFQAHPLHLHEPLSTLPMLAANLVVLEIKVNERIPRWLTELIAAHNLQLLRVSKYCRSIDAAQNMPGAGWRIFTAEHAQDVLSSSFSLYSSLERAMGTKMQETGEKV